MPRASSDILSKQALPLRSLALVLSLAPLTGAYIYNQGYQIPYQCPIHYFTGVPCPTCGMTRSLMALVRGEWLVAANYHLFGPLLFFVLVSTVVRLCMELVTQRPIALLNYSRYAKRRFILILLGALVGYHLTRLVTMYQDDILIDSVIASPLGQLLSSLANP